MKCIFCDKEATKAYRPDLDLTGLGTCDDHMNELTLMVLLWQGEKWGLKDVESYIKNIQKRDKKKAQK